MTRLDAAAMPSSDLNPFLFADIGTQTNGVELTVLSLLARLGSDPWVEAARLSLLPRAAATEWLAERIATTSLSGHAVGAARDTSATLLLLLPARTTVDRAVAGARDQGARTAWWVLGAMVAASLLGLLCATQHLPIARSTDQTIQGER